MERESHDDCAFAGCGGAGRRSLAPFTPQAWRLIQVKPAASQSIIICHMDTAEFSSGEFHA